MTFAGDEILVGLVALALLPLIALRIWRGARDGRLPIYRSYLERGESAAKFNALLGLHALSFVLVAIVAADLLLNLGLRETL
ncbi:MAG TPA: hypothetical protein VJS15_06615 [Allosphingosinicella sp.]|nr:hypothetical protein [Allosphingosinicella sp.]